MTKKEFYLLLNEYKERMDGVILEGPFYNDIMNAYNRGKYRLLYELVEMLDEMGWEEECV